MQLNRRLSERRKARLMDIGNHPVESELSRLGAMIGHESRAEDQMVLTILHGLATIITYQAKEIKEQSDIQHEQYSAQQEKINEHDDVVIKGKNTWWWITVIFGSLSTVFISLFCYGYIVISNIRDVQREQQAVEDYVNKKQVTAANAASDTNNQVTTHGNSIDQIQTELDRIKKLRAVKGSK